jgi:predicted ATPase
VQLYQVLGEGPAQSRFEVAVSRGLTPLVGRDHEVGLLQEQWARAKQGEGQVVQLRGEPGIGKSRLVQVVKDRVVQEGATRLEFRCSPYHQNSALYPVIEHLQGLLQFQRDDPPHIKLQKLITTLSAYRFPRADTVPLLAALLSLPHPEGYPPLTLSPQKQKQRTQEALVAWLLEESEKNPVYNPWEDLQWADPSSLDFLNLLIEQAPTAKLYLLLTFRPEFSPPWESRSHISQLTLNRLGRKQVEAMVSHVVAQTLRPSTSSGRTESGLRGETPPVRAEPVEARTALPTEVIQQIVAKTDGVPLFVEELTKAVVESVGAPSSVLVQALAIPATLHDSLMARLDRLGPVKEIAQLGATIGREFRYELLQAVSPLDETNLQQALARLVDAELLYQRGLLPQATYLFKHALIQDAAYQSLLRRTRQQYHQQIAQVLEGRFPETVETQPELLAHHYAEAGLIAQAIPYWQQAGQRASKRSANLEAISHLTKGLELLKTLPDTPERTQQELTLQIALGVPLMATKGLAAPDVGAVYTRARELCQQVGETPQLFPVLNGLWSFYVVRAEFQTSTELAEQLLRLAQSVQDPALLLQAHWALGVTLLQLGKFVSAREHCEQGIALYDPQQHRSQAFLYGFDPGVGCLRYAAWELWLLGYPDQALQRSHEALTLAQELSHPLSLAFALHFAVVLHQLRQERQAAQARAEAVIILSTEQGFALSLALGTIMRGWSLVEQGQGEEGIAQMRQGIAAFQATGAKTWWPYFLALLAEVHGKIGQTEEGLTFLAEALAQVEKTGERFYEAELYRLKGELLRMGEREKGGKGEEISHSPTPPFAPSSPEACFLKAIEIARRQQAKSLELRATVSLARLWQQQGKKEEARQMLAEIYNWFTEGFDTKDLQEAKALLEELE